MKPSLIKNKIFKNFGAYFLQFILTIFVIYFLVLVFLYFYQRSLLYHPNENNYLGDKISVDIENVKIQTSDNIELIGWYHEKNLKDYKTLIYFHGNAGSLENRIHKLNHFQVAIQNKIQSLIFGFFLFIRS